MGVNTVEQGGQVAVSEKGLGVPGQYAVVQKGKHLIGQIAAGNVKNPPDGVVLVEIQEGLGALFPAAAEGPAFPGIEAGAAYRLQPPFLQKGNQGLDLSLPVRGEAVGAGNELHPVSRFETEFIGETPLIHG